MTTKSLVNINDRVIAFDADSWSKTGDLKPDNSTYYIKGKVINIRQNESDFEWLADIKFDDGRISNGHFQSSIRKLNTIPEIYPTSLEECLKIFETIEYHSFGFGVVFLDYDYSVSNKWGICFRNPSNFSNPSIKENTPLEACHKMFNFLKTIKPKKDGF